MSIKTASVHARVQPSLKNKVEAVLDKLGISTSEAIVLYFNQIALQQGIPFDVKIPNKTTRKALNEAKTGKTRKFSSVEELMNDLNA